MTSPEKSFARRFRSSNSDRAGGSVVEAIVALALGLFVVQLCLTTAAQVRRSALRLADRQEVLVSLRIVRHVLRSELGHADATRDWSVAGDSLWLRAFRGTGLVCPDSPSPSEWVVAYRGERPPDPSKDSVEVTYPDGAVLYADLTGYETLRFYGRMFRVPDLDHRIELVAEQMGVTRHLQARVGTLSHGMQKRLSLARALLHDPPILLLDEPETGLDQEALELLDALLTGSEGAHRTVLMTTHNLEWGLAFGDTIAILAQGRIAYQESRDRLDEAEFRDTFTRYLGAAQ